MDPPQQPPLLDDDMIVPGQQQWRPNLPHHFYPPGVTSQSIDPEFKQVLPHTAPRDALSHLASAAAISDPYSISPASSVDPTRLPSQEGPSAFVGSEDLARATIATTAQQREQTRARRRVPNSQRKRTQVSCDACKTRRCKCVRLSPSPETPGHAARQGDLPPCKLCVETGIPCVTTMPRKQRVYGSVENLDKRYRALEALVSGLFPDLDPRASAEELVVFGRGRAISMPDFHELSDRPRTPTAEPKTKPDQSEYSTGPAGGKNANLIIAGTDDDKTILPPAYIMRATAGSSLQTSPDSTVDGVADPSAEHTGLILDATGRAHYVGPCGGLAFFAKMRELFSQRFGAMRSPDDPERMSSHLGRDRTGQLTNNPLAASLGGIGDRGRGSGSPSDKDHTPQPPGHRNLDHLDGDSPPRICENMLREHPNDPEFWRYRKRVSLLELPPRDRADACVEAFFRNVHPNFVLFHRLTFQSAYEKMWRCWDAHRSRNKDGQAKEVSVSVGWLCCLYMIFILGSRSLPQNGDSLEFQRNWFVQVDRLPPLLGTSSLPNVCAYMLLSLYYHNTNDRTSAWTFHGAACRLAIALGMHRESSSGLFDPLERQLRKLVWWTSYDYEQFLCCSLGRPSAIDDREMDVGIPDDEYLDSNLIPPRYIEYSARLNMLIAAIRRGIFDPGFVPERRYSRAMEFMETTVRWEDELPRGLRPVAFEASYGNASQWRNAIMLNIRYHHALTFLTRPFLFETISSVDGDKHLEPDACKIRALSKICLTAAMRCGDLIIRLWQAGQVNGVNWIDIYYAYLSCLDISLALISPESLRQGEEHPDIRKPGLILNHTTDEMKDVVRQLCDVMSSIELCGTNARFAKAAFEFASALGIIPVERILSLRMQVPDPKTMAVVKDTNEGKYAGEVAKGAEGIPGNRGQDIQVGGLDQSMSGMSGYYHADGGAMNLDVQENLDSLPVDAMGSVQWDM
ncbi:hypothetical protein F4818DRAFT_259555 [Hypoxylon cercidicola]|nr:hypothetical protein F4818DRAFT_259555 [Hypoxylon cercidicola]